MTARGARDLRRLTDEARPARLHREAEGSAPNVSVALTELSGHGTPAAPRPTAIAAGRRGGALPASVVVPTIAVVEHDPRLFFQVASGLIPALVFGGLISEKLRPPSGPPRRRTWIASLVVVVVAQVVLYAEVIAITVALSGEADRLDTWFVALVLVGLTAAALGSLALPWYRNLFRGASRAVGRRSLYAGHMLMAAAALAAVVLAANLLTDAVRAEQDLQRLDAALSEAAQHDTASQFLAAYDRVYQVRAAAGLVPKAEARRVHVCLADRAFLEAFRAAVQHVAPDYKGDPAKVGRALLPGRRMECPAFLNVPPEVRR